MHTTYSADINGVVLTAANVKLLDKLVKKEQARQEAEKTRQDENEKNANEIAWAHYGKTLYVMKRDHLSLWFTKPTIRRIDDYYQAVKVEHHRHGQAEFRIGTEYRCETILMTVEGDTLALRSFDSYVLNDKGVTWFTVGAYHGSCGYHYLDDDEAAKLEAAYQSDLAKHGLAA